jgi:transcription elongation factor Elf1
MAGIDRRVAMPAIYVGPDEIKTSETLAGQLFCPRCTSGLSDQGITSAFWRAEDTIYFAWCRNCGWRGDIVEISFVTGWEIDEDDSEPPY